jgi:hypothetical protein
MTTNHSFGEAIAALHDGKRVSREGWNGKGMFVFKQVPSQIPFETIPKMQSLPQSVKDEFQRRFDSMAEPSTAIGNHPHDNIRYKNQLAMVYPDNNIYGWVASPSDVLENDWCILD